MPAILSLIGTVIVYSLLTVFVFVPAAGGSAVNHTCQGRAFIKNQTCSSDVCTYPYGYVDPKTGTKFLSTQPPFGHCTDVSGDVVQKLLA